MALNKIDSTDILVAVETPYVSVTIKKSGSGPSFAGNVFPSKEASLRVFCEDEFNLSMQGEPEILIAQNPGQMTGESYLSYPLFFEQQRYEMLIEPEAGHTVEFWHDNYNIRKGIARVGRRTDMLFGGINFNNEIGYSDLVIRVDGRDYLTITLEVFPTKISYKDDYQAILSDVATEVYNLVFDFLKKTYHSFSDNGKKPASPVEFFAIIQKIYGDFLKASDMVLRKPHHMLKTEHEIVPGHKVKRIDNKTFRWLERHPEHVLKKDGQFQAAKALAVKKYVTYDTKENRLIKYILHSSIKRLEAFKKQYQSLGRQTDGEIVNRIDKMMKEISRRCHTGVLKDISANAENIGMSLVFGMAPGYRELYRCYLLLQHGLSVSGSLFDLSVKDLAVLYEYWCFIKMNSLLKNRYQLMKQDIIKINKDKLFVTLVKGRQSRVRYQNPENGEEITLYYNKAIDRSPTVSQKPDNILELTKKDQKTSYSYIFDAKYRINPALNGSDYQRKYKTPGPQEDDINTMHRYRDAIVYSKETPLFERTMFGAYILFPYADEKEYRKHHFYDSIDKVNVGGLPFLPSATSMVTELLDELIADSPQTAFERATLPVGVEEHLERVDWEKKDVLIGTLEDEREMVYYPKRNYFYTYKENIAQDKLPIHYVALYEKNIGIRYYGEVLEIRVQKRNTLPGNGKKKNADCYRFEVKEWKLLETPIKADSYGPSSVAYTNYFLLMHSVSYPELHLKNKAEYRFFTELKRRSEEVSVQNSSGYSEFELNGARIRFSKEQIQVIRKDAVVEECEIDMFLKKPAAVFRRIRKYAEE